MNRTKIILKCLILNNSRIIPIFGFTLSLTMYSLKTQILEIIFYGIPNSIIFNDMGHLLGKFDQLSICHNLYHLFLLQNENQFIEWKTNRNEEKKAIHKNQRNSSIIWFVIFRDQWIQHYFLVENFILFWALLGTINVFMITVILFVKLEVVTNLIIIYWWSALQFNIHIFNIHRFFSDLLCEQILQNIEFIDYIVF